MKQREHRMRTANAGLHEKPHLWLSSKDVAAAVSFADLSSSTCQLMFVFSALCSEPFFSEPFSEPCSGPFFSLYSFSR